MVRKVSRDPRRRVVVQAELKHEDRHTSATILNISRRGLLASCPEPPTRGHYVELRVGGRSIVGRVIWSKTQVFGVRTQDDIDVEALSGGRPAGATSEKAQASKLEAAAAGKAGLRDPIDSYERSRIAASRMSYAAGLIIALVGAALIAGLFHELASESLNTATEALKRRN